MKLNDSSALGLSTVGWFLSDNSIMFSIRYLAQRCASATARKVARGNEIAV